MCSAWNAVVSPAGQSARRTSLCRLQGNTSACRTKPFHVQFIIAACKTKLHHLYGGSLSDELSSDIDMYDELKSGKVWGDGLW